MKCPNCPDTHLVTTDRDGVAVDCCPRCRGGWLDRDELDKNIDGAASDHTSIAPVAQGNASARAMSSNADYTSILPRRRKSILGEIFNF